MESADERRKLARRILRGDLPATVTITPSAPVEEGASALRRFYQYTALSNSRIVQAINVPKYRNALEQIEAGAVLLDALLREITVEATSGESKKAKTTPAQDLPASWVESVRTIAKEYIARHKDENLFPSLEDVCSHIERVARKSKIHSDHDKPLSLGYIKRNAISGAWWQANKPR